MLRSLLLLACCFLLPLPGLAAEWTNYVLATSDYVYRGATQSDGEPAIQLGTDLGFDSGLFFGAWASTVDIRSRDGDRRDQELRAYVGYGFDLGRDYRLTVNTVGYWYPGYDGETEYDGFEASAALGIRDRLWVEYGFAPNLYETDWDVHNLELYSEWPFTNGFSLSGGIGMIRVTDPASSETLHWNLGVSYALWKLDFDLRLHNAEDAIRFISDEDRIGRRLAVSVRYSF